MKFTKRKVFVAALATCLIAILSMGSLAWFSASDSVVNEFKVADSDADTPDEIFSVDVWEYTDNSPTEKVDDGDTYTDILPGALLKKEPHVENTGYYDQYIRVIIEISDYNAWLTAANNDFDYKDLLVGFDADMWEPIQVTTPDDTAKIVLYYKDKLASGKDITVFTDVKIPDSLTQAQAAEFDGGFTINVKAQAVQTENVGANAVEAFTTVGMEP